MSEERVGISVTDNVSPNISLKIREIGEQARIAHERLLKLNQSVKGIGAIASQQAKIESATARVATAFARSETAQARVLEAQSRVEAANNRQIVSQNRVQASVERTNAAIQRAQDASAASSARLAAAQTRASSAITVAKAKEEKANLQVAASQSVAMAAATRAETAVIRSAKLQADASAATARAQGAQATATAASTRAQAAATIANDNSAAAAARAEAAQNRQALSALRLQNAQQRQVDTANRVTQRTIAAAKAEADAATSAAFAAANAGKSISGNAAAMNRGTLSAKQYRAALNLLPAQFTDIVVSLQGGQAPLTVLLQQGGQLKDMFGGIMPALRAMAGYVMALVKPWMLVAAAVGVLLFQFYKFEKQLRTTNSQLAQFQASGRTGIDSQFLKGIREELDALPAVSKKAANSVIQEFASVRTVAGTQMQAATRVVRDFAYATGADLPAAAKTLATALGDPIKGAEKLDEQLGFLTASEFKQIDALQKSGKVSQAQDLILSRLETRVKGLADEGMTPLQKATAGFGKQWSELMKSMGAPAVLNGLETMLIGIVNLMSKVMAAMKFLVDSAKQVWKALSGDKTLEQQLADTESDLERRRKEGPGVMERGTWAAHTRTKEDRRDALRAQIAARDALAPVTPGLIDNSLSKTTAQKIKESGIKGPGAEEKAAEKRAASLAKVNLELDNELRLQGMLGTQREAATRFAQIEESLTGKRIKLTDQERAAIKRKVDLVISGRDAEAARNQVYEEAFGAAKKYNAQLAAMEQLEKQGVITTEELNRQRTMLKFQYEDSINPLKRATDELDRSNALMHLNSEEMGIANQVESKRQELLRSRGVVNEQELAQYREKLVLQQELTRVQQAYNSIYQQTKGTQQELVAQQQALNMAVGQGLISTEQYGIRINQLAIQMAQLRMNSGFGDFEDVAMASMGRIVDGYQGMLSGLSNSFGDFFTTLTDGFANSFGRAIVYGESLKTAMMDVVQQGISALIAGLVKLGIQYAINATIASTVGAGATAASAALGATTAAAWAPAAAMVSLASFGANVGPATVALASAVGAAKGLSMLGGFEKGGYTGNMGTSSVAGLVHGKEFVFDAGATAAIGVDTLERIRSSAGKGGGYSSRSSGTDPFSQKGNMVVNIYPPDGMQAKTQERETEDGMQLDVTFDSIENALASRINSGRGALVDAQRSTFGLSVKAGRP